MIVEPKVRGFICTTAHPEGCKAAVLDQIAYLSDKSKLTSGPKRVLVLGASTGYGLASRIVASELCEASTIGVFFERPAVGKRTASAGWYNTVAFENEMQSRGRYAKSINGDAFSEEIKQQTIDLIKQDFGQVDLVVYSLAAPRRTAPDGKTYVSTLKPIGSIYRDKTVDIISGKVTTAELMPATSDEVSNTIAVMGGDDWKLWIEALLSHDVLAPQAKTVAYSYIGPEMTYPIYREGTIGKAKEDLEAAANQLNQILKDRVGGSAYISVNKGLVTQASSAIPVVPLYMSVLYKVMKELGLHEGCIEQMYRLFAERLYSASTPTDELGRIRLDDFEMKQEVQDQVKAIWDQITTETIDEVTDIAGYRDEFYKLFGFNFSTVDYTKEVIVDCQIPSITE